MRLGLPHQPRILAPKAVTGEFGGGTLAAAMLAIAGADFAKPLSYSEPDPELNVCLEGGPVTANNLLCSAHAAGGVSSWITFYKP